MKDFKYEQLVRDAIQDSILRLELEFLNSNENGVELRNGRITISISDRLHEFNFVVSNGVESCTIGQFIVKRYPNYFAKLIENPSIKVFKKKEEDFDTYETYFQYLVKTSFDFIEENFPEVLQGQF